MAYIENNWQTGDMITVEKLNKIEEQVSNLEPLVVNSIEEAGNSSRLDKTFNEIYNAIVNGRVLLTNTYSDFFPETANANVLLNWTNLDLNNYLITIDGLYYMADDGNSYPYHNEMILVELQRGNFYDIH